MEVHYSSTTLILLNFYFNKIFFYLNVILVIDYVYIYIKN